MFDKKVVTELTMKKKNHFKCTKPYEYESNQHSQGQEKEIKGIRIIQNP